MQNREQQFKKLMTCHLSGDISDKDEQMLLDILNSDPYYKTLYNELVKTRAISQIPIIESEKTNNYKLLSELINNGFSHFILPVFLKNFLRIAAIIVFLFSTSLSSYYIYTKLSTSNNVLSYETIVPHGSQSKIVLPDKTTVWLNSGSKLKYNANYGKDNRTVELTGEAYFEVSKNKNKPFLVIANSIKVKVLGTVFNVRSYSNEKNIEVNLLEGKVDVSLNIDDSPDKLSLIPNQKVVYDKSEKTFTTSNTDASKAASWTTGKLCFVDASLQDIAKDLERRFDVKIIFKTQSIKNELYSGSLDLKQPITQILEYIDVDRKYNRKYVGDRIYIENK